MDDKMYFKIFSESFQNLVKVSVKKQYKCLVPPAKYITQNMFILSFYENHIFFQCDYDPSLFISLSGKVIQQNPSEEYFQTYIGYKKHMRFNVLGKSYRELPFTGVDSPPTIAAINIDNVIDENCYNPPNTSMKESTIKRDVLTRYETKEEYLNFYKQLLNNQDYKEVDNYLTSTIKRMMNDYILIKNHIQTYLMYFLEGFIPIKETLTQKLEKFRNDELYLYIILELSESIIFDKMYPFLIKSLKSFFKEEEAIFKSKNKSMDFNFVNYKLNPALNDCKFPNAIKEFNNFSKYTTPFEKIKVISNVHTYLEKEAKECVEKRSNKKDVFIATGDTLLPIWLYIVINCDVPNLLAEVTFLQQFKLKGSNLEGEADYHMTNMFAAVEQLNKDNQCSKAILTPYTINTQEQNYNNDMDFSFNAGTSSSSNRAQSFVPKYDNSNTKEVDEGKSSSKFSQFKNMFAN